MKSPAKSKIKKQSKRRDRSPAGVEYHGIAGSSRDCQHAVMRLLQCAVTISNARIISSGSTHCLLLTNEIGDHIAVKSGFSSGYGGTGPTCFSAVLRLLDSHGSQIDECTADDLLIERLDKSALTVADVENIAAAAAIRPSRWFQYILDQHQDQDRDSAIWREFSPVIPFSIIDVRIMDLARNFWDDADSALSRAYRRLEDIVRKRTGLTESSTKLFSRAFTGKDAMLTWIVPEESERNGRMTLFTGTYMAYRNPRAHQEIPKSELLAEFMLLNQLYRLESEAVNTGALASADQLDKIDAT